jgi:membrane-bound lytic murein transglycosylase F
MPHRSIFALLALLTALQSCGPAEQEHAPDTPPAPQPPALYTGDLDEITARGTVRVLVEGGADRPLPRAGDPALRGRELAETFARHQGLEVEFIPHDTFADLLPALESGAGDLIAANMTVTAERQERVTFTVPLGQTHEVLVRRTGEESPATPEDVQGRIGMRAGTTFEATALEMASRNPFLQVVAYPGAMDPDGVLDSLNAGDVDYAIEDQNRLDVFLEYRGDVQPGIALTTERPLAWAVRRSNPELLATLNNFLHEEALLRRSREPGVVDLPAIKERGKIRMITRNNAATYFLWRGQVLGFEYELARKFAEENGLRLEVVVAPTHEDLLPMLRSGEGDFVAAFLTATEERAHSGIQFSRPYHFASEVLVGRIDEPPLDSIEDLKGRTISARRSSSYWESLSRIESESAIGLELAEAPESMETEAIMAAVAEGTYDLTVADSHLLELEMTIRDDLRGLLQISEPVPHGWAVHPDNEALLAAMNQFIRQNYKGLFYNVTWKKYFERPRGTSA